jgi:integrase
LIAYNRQFDHITDFMSDQVVKKNGQNRRPQQARVKGLTKIGGRYYFRPAQREGVRPPRVALHTESFDEAVKMALELQRVAQGIYKPGLLSFEINRFNATRGHEISRWSRDSEESVLRLFLGFAGDGMVGLITPRKLEQWRDEMLVAGKSAGTVKTYMTRVGTFFEWLMKQGGLSRNPVKLVKLPESRKTKVDRFCIKPEREKLLGLCDRDDLRAVLLLGFHCGMRLNEIIQARKDWLRFWRDGEGIEHGEIMVMRTDTFTPKDKEARAIPLNTLVLDFFRGCQSGQTFLIRPEVKQGKDKYRWNPRRPFQNLCDKAGLAWVGAHTMRHTYATHLVMAGVPIATVARWLGDGIEVTYRNYAGYQPNRAHVDAGL